MDTKQKDLEQAQTIQEKLLAFTKEKEIDSAIKSLMLQFIEVKLAYWTLIDKQFEAKKGIKFQEYHDTKYEEWDGSDWSKVEEFHDWEDAIFGIMYYKDLKTKWI